ncbi:MAG: helix-turn-helix domain-containing protein [Gammaproteobacteria bacterium]|nr:helix-turn-helix domain-containing protein [Gammaproteobacteria bacterium]
MQQRIPSYALFSESLDQPPQLAIHIEAIAERSRKHDWTIASHRHPQLFQFIYIAKGQARVGLDGDVHQCANQTLISIPPFCVHDFVFSPDTMGYVLSIDARLEALSKIDLGLSAKAQVFSRVDDEQLLRLLKDILEEYTSSHSHRANTLEALIQLWCIYIRRRFVLEAPNSTASARFLSFIQLLDQHHTNSHEVSFYAQKLNISNPTLNRICQRNRGISAKQMILNRIIDEAIRRLVYTRMPIDTIGYELGFNDPSYFARFFKRQTKQSPKDFRQNHRR